MPDYRTKALEVLATKRGKFAFEDIRREVEAAGIFAPKPKCWGPLARELRAAGALQFTGEWRKAVSKKTNGHEVKLYVRGKAKLAA